VFKSRIVRGERLRHRVATHAVFANRGAIDRVAVGEVEPSCRLGAVQGCLGPTVTRRHAPAGRRFLATSDRCASACPISESRAARACEEARSLETPIGLAFRQVDRLLTPGHSAVSSVRRFAGQPPVPVGCAAPEGSLNLSRTSTFALRVPAAAAAMLRVIRDERPIPLQRWEGIRCGLAMMARPAWRR
jgi:hypothetical protein